MTSFVVLRMVKHKADHFARVNGHNSRTIPVKHSNPNGYHSRIYGDKNKTIKTLFDDRLNKIKMSLTGVRSDAVLFNELVISASPEFFRPNDPSKWGEFNKQKTNEWVKATCDWLKNKYGDNLISVDLHCDEATPHLHVIITPLVSKTKNKRRTQNEIATKQPAKTYSEWTFDSKTMFGKKELVTLQTEAAKAVKSLGIKRGIPGSKTTHEKVDKYYTRVNTTNDPIHDPIDLAVPAPPLMAKEKTRKTWAEEITKSLLTNVKKLTENLSNDSELWKQRFNHVNRRLKAATTRLDAWCKGYGSPSALQSHLDSLERDLNKAKYTSHRLINENLILKQQFEYVNHDLVRQNEILKQENQKLIYQLKIKNKDTGLEK